MDVSTGFMTIQGLDDINNKLHQLKPALSKQIMTDALKKGAKVFQEEARLKAPQSTEPHILKSYASLVFKKYTPRQFGTWVQPGNLKRNISVKLDREGTTKDRVRVVVYIKKGAWYGKFLEFTTSRGRLTPPFMTPAFEAKKEEATKAVIDHLHAVLESGGFVK